MRPLIMTTASLPVPAAAEGLLDPAGPIAAAQGEHFLFIAGIMVVVVLPLFLALPIVLWRYRRRGAGGYRPDWDSNAVLEVLVWGVPVAVVAVLAVKLWYHTKEYDPYRPLGVDPLVIEVVSLDWKFLFIYPEQGVATVDLLVLPENRPVTLKLTSGTVMQSFIVPRLAGQIYTMAGMMTQLNLVTGAAGEFTGRNTQYNGNGFATQSFETLVVPEADFAVWADEVKAGSNRLDWTGFQKMLEPSEVEQPILYAGYEAGLFNRVIASFAPEMAGKDHSGTVYPGPKADANK